MSAGTGQNQELNFSDGQSRDQVDKIQGSTIEPLSSTLPVGQSIDKSSSFESPLPASTRLPRKKHVKMHRAKGKPKNNKS